MNEKLKELIEEKEKEFEEKIKKERPAWFDELNSNPNRFNWLKSSFRTAIEQSYLSALEDVEGEIKEIEDFETGEEILSQLKEKIKELKSDK